MIYLIDANNLAGKLGLLDEKDFDKILTSRVADFFADKQVEIILVFDSADPLGDRYHQDNLEIVYTPRDDFYCGADDKIMEILRRRLAEQALKEEIVVATDDLGLQNSVKGAKAESANGARVKIMTATDLARRLAELAEKDGLADEKNIDAGDLNKELLKIWGRKKD